MELSFDFSRKIGTIKPMHAVGQPPMIGLDCQYLHYLTDAHIPYSRLHDVGGTFGGNCFVDIPNLFRNFDADENDPQNYDFTFTDVIVKGLADAGCQPIFRLGVSIENYHFLRAYRIFPPADPAKWARICEHIVRHYNEGWAEGFHLGITYWEIWNEPDNGESDANNMMWHGTPEQYYQLYEVTSKHLRACFGDSIKIGGYGHSGLYALFKVPEQFGLSIPSRGEPNAQELHFMTFADHFFAHIKKTGAPIDFFSWHSYASVEDTEIMADFIESLLKKWGYEGIETHLNEWNNYYSPETRGTSLASAGAAAMMIAQHDKATSMLCFYDARIGQSVYGGLFNPISYLPFCTYYSFAAFGELYALGNQVAADYPKGQGIYALAAEGNGRRAVLITNTGKAKQLLTNLSGMKVFLIDQEHMMTETSDDPADLILGENQTILIRG